MSLKKMMRLLLRCTGELSLADVRSYTFLYAFVCRNVSQPANWFSNV